MAERLAIKRFDAWLWRSNLSLEDVLLRLEDGRIRHDWLICPQGAASRAIMVGEFVDDPTIFQRQELEIATKKRRKREVASAVAKPPLLKFGQRLIYVYLLCLVIGGPIVRLVFPHLIGAGLRPLTLLILIPIYSIGIIGLITAPVGWIQHQLQIRSTLEREFGRNDPLA